MLLLGRTESISPDSIVTRLERVNKRRDLTMDFSPDCCCRRGVACWPPSSPRRLVIGGLLPDIAGARADHAGDLVLLQRVPDPADSPPHREQRHRAAGR